jgi:hypothetical protein
VSRVRVVISCLLCSLVALAVWPAGATAKGGAGPTAGITPIYRLEPLHARVLIPLDPATLADDSSLGGVTLGLTPLGKIYDFAGELPQIVTSPGGTMMAVVRGCSGCSVPSTRYTTIRIVTANGHQLAAWHPPKPMQIEYVSNNGKVVAGHAFNLKARGLAAWLVLNGKTGKIMHRVANVDGTFDPALNRFYLGNTAGGMYTLTAYDGGTGGVIARLPLPGVAAQQTQEPASGGETAVIDNTWPAFAISPDGQRIAVVDGANETLTMIDAPHLRVLSTNAIHQPESWTQRLGEFLGIIPSTAEAKGPVKGTLLGATFSRDGRSLYVTGETATPAGSGPMTNWSYLPLRRIDVATGAILAQQAEDNWSYVIGQSVDGGALFVSVTLDGGYGMDLREYDASSLQLLAHRVFNEDQELVLLKPAGS